MTTLKEEEPYAAAVDTAYLSLTCSKCFAWRSVGDKRAELSGCFDCEKIRYCCPLCKHQDREDHKGECERLQSAGFIPSKEARLVMRMIEKSRRELNPKSFNGRTYFTLDDNYAKLRGNAHCMAKAGKIYSEIYRFMGPDAPNLEEVFRAYCKMTINSFEICDGSWNHTSRGVGLYLELSVLKHSCRPDAFVINQGSKMKLRTTNKDLVYSDKLTISYVDDGEFFFDTEGRRADLQKHFSFHCKCDQCLDVESNKKKISGRSLCCPGSWFSISDGICNDCMQKVSTDVSKAAEDAVKRINGAISVMTAIEDEESGFDEDSAVFDLVPKWTQLADFGKKVLTDENRRLFSIMHTIALIMPLIDAEVACKYVDWCIPLARESPHCVFSAVLFACRQQYYEWAKKPLQQTCEALHEALECVEVVFGPEHDLTRTLLLKGERLLDELQRERGMISRS